MTGVIPLQTMSKYNITIESFTNLELYAKYTCLSCKHLMFNAVQSEVCGHLFCEACILELLKTTNPICPDCNERLDSGVGDPGYYQDIFVRRRVADLEMVCLHQQNGCKWEGLFGNLNGHLSECEHTSCDKCLQMLTTSLDLHICAEVRCPMHSLGCTKCTFDTAAELQAHLSKSEIRHLSLMVKWINTFPLPPLVSKPTREYTWQIASNCIGQGINSDTEQGHKLSLATSVDGHVTETDDNSVTCFTKHDTIGQLRERIKDLTFKSEEFLTLREKVTKMEKLHHTDTGDVVDRDFRLSLIENASYDGSTLWKIPQFNQRRMDAESGKYTSIFSLPFYTARHGYKMCLRLYILGDGTGKNECMSLFFVLMKGEYDNVLAWPFNYKVTFKLLNPDKPSTNVQESFQPNPKSSSFKQPRTDMNIASGSPRFISHAQLNRSGFIKDDTVFIKCIVDTHNITHP